MVSDSIRTRGENLVGNVETLEYRMGGVYGIVRSGEMYHHVSLKFDGRTHCGCKGGFYEGVCSHMVAVAEAVEMDSVRDKLFAAIESDPTMSVDDLYVETELSEFNELMGTNGVTGGLPKKSGMVLAGRPQAGKTIFSYQMVFEAMKKMSVPNDKQRYTPDEGENLNALIVDTEGSMYTYELMKETFENRYQIDTALVEVDVIVDGARADFQFTRDPEADHQIFVMDVRQLDDILTIHGRPAEIGTEGGNMSIHPDGEHKGVWESPMGQFAHKNDICYMAYDSITNPIETTFTNRQQDFPPRSKATQWWMGQVQGIAQELEVVQLYTTHLTKNPTQQWDRPDYVGGKSVKHNNKHAVYLHRAEDGLRAMQLFRHPAKPEWEEEVYLSLEEGKGYKDAD